MKKILVSTISYFNDKKEKSSIYMTFAKRLINDVLTKTPYDILVNTNRSDLFDDVEKNDRLTIRQNNLENHKTHVGVFNQLLKFSAIKEINSNYDYVLYLDCDAGFIDVVDTQKVDKHIDMWEGKGHDMVALRTNYPYILAEKEYYDAINEGKKEQLFHKKFVFYGVNPEWRGSLLPSEHILLIKNDEKLAIMAEKFEEFCTLFETQDERYPAQYDMEAFEIGISAFLAGYNMGEMGWAVQNDVLKVGFNANNWEKIKV